MRSVAGFLSKNEVYVLRLWTVCRMTPYYNLKGVYKASRSTYWVYPIGE